MCNYDGREYKVKCQRLREQLKDRIHKYIVYNDKDKRGARLTICVGVSKDGTISRGIAICSPEDNFCRAVGQFYAMKRVLKANKHKKMMERGTVLALGDLRGIPKVQWDTNVSMEEELML